MEATTPPNTSGFSKKPTRKKRNPLRSRNNGHRKASANHMDGMPKEATAWLCGSMFLMAAAKLLAPFIGNTRQSSSTTTG